MYLYTENRLLGRTRFIITPTITNPTGTHSTATADAGTSRHDNNDDDDDCFILELE